VRMTTFVLGDPADENSPVAGIFEMPPNFVLPRHAHPCERVEVVIKGSIDVGDRTLGPGDVMTASSGEPYGEHIAGPDGCTTVEIVGTLAGAHQLLWPTGDDQMELIDMATPEAAAMMSAAIANGASSD
jgi:hypothetical protein